MGKLRLTTAQALVKFLDNQYLEVDGVELKFVKGIFAIFGHGNVLGLGQALEQDSGDMRVYQGRNEQGMAHAATGFARQALRRQIIACTSSIGPGAANMITAAGTASANRIPLLLLPGDVFATRQPDPVLQQIEQSYDLSISTNDAFRAVSKYWDRITRPEQLMSACINAMRVLTDPCGNRRGNAVPAAGRAGRSLGLPGILLCAPRAPSRPPPGQRRAAGGRRGGHQRQP
ncbi:3D-(3,5/4)-trihydroxycyclohexane-1,2-dione hydrolase [Klebsiella pneumoniae]|nr:3D-(3,5/4)-trihydroxycyclohexane-1,2-dione hydrolase [Klebsiella pneumoniae]